MVLFPVAPGPPLGVYQNGFGSLMLFGPSVRTDPEKPAVRLAMPQPLPNTYPPPFDGISNTFMNPCQGEVGSTTRVVAAVAACAVASAETANINSIFSFIDVLPKSIKAPCICT